MHLATEQPLAHPVHMGEKGSCDGGRNSIGVIGDGKPTCESIGVGGCSNVTSYAEIFDCNISVVPLTPLLDDERAFDELELLHNLRLVLLRPRLRLLLAVLGPVAAMSMLLIIAGGAASCTTPGSGSARAASGGGRRIGRGRGRLGLATFELADAPLDAFICCAADKKPDNLADKPAGGCCENLGVCGPDNGKADAPLDVFIGRAAHLADNLADKPTVDCCESREVCGPEHGKAGAPIDALLGCPANIADNLADTPPGSCCSDDVNGRPEDGKAGSRQFHGDDGNKDDAEG
jgi:hypothetical protein